METATDEHGGGDVGQQRWIRRQRRWGAATDEMWDDRYGKMGCRDGNGLGKYKKGMTANLRAYHFSRIMGMVDKISGEDSGGRARFWRCGTTGMDTGVEEIRDGNKQDVGRRRWRNGFEERQ